MISFFPPALPAAPHSIPSPATRFSPSASRQQPPPLQHPLMFLNPPHLWCMDVAFMVYSWCIHGAYMVHTWCVDGSSRHLEKISLLESLPEQLSQLQKLQSL
ncbi:unnamed protein product [Closterium sp. NIES-54]